MTGQLHGRRLRWLPAGLFGNMEDEPVDEPASVEPDVALPSDVATVHWLRGPILPICMAWASMCMRAVGLRGEMAGGVPRWRTAGPLSARKAAFAGLPRSEDPPSAMRRPPSHRPWPTPKPW